MSVAARKIQKYGWVPDIPDARDFKYYADITAAHLPPSIDLRQQCPPIYDQGQLGSCTANAIAGALEFDMIKQFKPQEFMPSRLFIYYNERVIEGTVDEDSGAMLRDGIKTVHRQGDCPEPTWPYDISKFAVKPPQSCYDAAIHHRALSYKRIYRFASNARMSERMLKSVLASGYPFVFGFAVYESFESEEVAKTGIVPMPSQNEVMIGGHAVLAVGYDDNKRIFIVRNSWGNDWGMNGYFQMPYDYLLDDNLSDDFWMIKLVS